MHIRLMRSGVIRFALTIASYVATSRCRWLMNAPKGTPGGPERCARTLAGVAVDLTAAIPIIIARPLVHPMADGGMGRMAPPIALPLIGREPCAARGKILRD
jgi:hypothetical protein